VCSRSSTWMMSRAERCRAQKRYLGRGQSCMDSRDCNLPGNWSVGDCDPRPDLLLMGI